MLISGAKIQMYLKSFETFKRNFWTLWELIEIFLRRGPLVPRHFSSLRSIIYYLGSKSFDDSFIHFSSQEGGKIPQKLGRCKASAKTSKPQQKKNLWDHRIIVCSWCLMDLFVFMEKTSILTRYQIIDRNLKRPIEKHEEKCV